ncbi:TPA: hypothetical protein RUY63_002897 [Aeromonas dhakensis]|nr:hypothetical protein [Aeromonas dhakensis]HDX8389378.1 hypothetical protein [Aeromonas dhakensis]HDX8394561.1 hypothetical protein [Aeromonas dhakensis]HDX8397444.1 hypothetical protein [Aeromonas dhakensis]HDX8410784.1 hypothetical protein [Aeromonas dhakensis]
MKRNKENIEKILHRLRQ